MLENYFLWILYKYTNSNLNDILMMKIFNIYLKKKKDGIIIKENLFEILKLKNKIEKDLILD